MTPSERILADAREFEANSGIRSDVYLAAICAALARGVSTGFVRAGCFKPPSKAKREAHPETKLEGEV